VLRPVQIPVEVPRHHGTIALALPNGVIALFGLLLLVSLVGVRVLARAIHERRLPGVFRGVREGERGVLVVGAGDGGRLVVREIVRNRELGLAPVGFLDDDPRKRGLKDEHGLRVLGTTESDDLSRVLDEVEPDEVVIAIPSAPGTVRAHLSRAMTALRNELAPATTTGVTR